MMCTQQEVCKLLNEVHPDSEPISKSTENIIDQNYRQLRHLKYASKHFAIYSTQDIILWTVENPHCTVILKELKYNFIVKVLFSDEAKFFDYACQLPKY